MKFSRYGIGGIVADKWVSRDDFKRMLDISVERLVMTYIDTAKAYEDAEEVIGDWLRTRPRAGLTIGSKIGARGVPGGKLTRDAIITAAREAREKLGQLDLFWMHAPDTETPLDEQIAGFRAVVAQGLAREFGVSNVSRDQLAQILAMPGLKPIGVQNEFNLLERASDVRAICRRHGLKFFAYSPLASGVLAGRYKWNQEMPSDSRWASWSKRRALPSYWTEATFAKIERLGQLAEQKGVSMAALALAWTATQVDVTLLGSRTMEQFRSAEEAAGVKDVGGVDEIFNLDN